MTRNKMIVVQRLTTMAYILVFQLLYITAEQNNALCPSLCSCHTKEAELLTLEVDCSHQDLTQIPTLAATSSVVSLDLSYNSIGKLESHSLKHYFNVHTLSLRNARIRNIDHTTFQQLGRLTTVDLSNNFLAYIFPDMFAENPNLKSVSLRSNPLSMMPDNIPILISVSLVYLDLSSCKISNISPQTFSKLPQLRNLDLSENRLHSTTNDTLMSLSHVKNVSFRRNKWICGRHFNIFLCWLRQRSAGQLQCYTKRRDVRSYNLAELDISCSDTSSTRPVSSTTPETETVDNLLEINMKTVDNTEQSFPETTPNEDTTDDNQTSSAESTTDTTVKTYPSETIVKDPVEPRPTITSSVTKTGTLPSSQMFTADSEEVISDANATSTPTTNIDVNPKNKMRTALGTVFSVLLLILAVIVSIVIGFILARKVNNYYRSVPTMEENSNA
ncbi:leucine-rich repeat-containing protein egg-6-like [Periplaneta americana]|uniref:leucine-rich repeat-containing protein egg-6-like n=1 Tax=Periplaneta americana TaxID=6978 RepID=UPI0037E948AF